jgi:Zn-dependent protease with chaperone function
MSEQAKPDVGAPAPERARVNVLAFVLPTTTRYLAFLAALLSAGVFVGGFVYNQIQGEHWVRVVINCAAQAQQAKGSLPILQADLEQVALESKCRGTAELGRAAYALSGIGVAGAGALVVVYLAPVIVRRRRRLHELGPSLKESSDRFATLASEAGIRGALRVERGSARQHDAFSYGPPGRPRIVLPPAVVVRWRDRELFDPLVRHELAHVRHRDVALAWLVRSAWYALLPLLALPVVVALVSGDHSILGDFLWRAILLGLTVLFVSTALLRSREYDADLRAAQMAGEIDSLTSVLRRSPGRAKPSWLRYVVGRHPTPDQRAFVLQNPERAADITFLDGFSAAFLAGLLLPPVANVLVVIFTGWGRTDLGNYIAALLAGPLLGGSVGLGLWRAAATGRVAGVGVRVAPVAAGVAAGLALGQFASLENTGSGAIGGLSQPAWLVVSAVLGAGATAMCAGMGQLWADALPRMHRRMAVTAAVIVSSLIFASALWIGAALQFVLDNGGPAMAREWLVIALPSSGLVIATVTILGLAASWALLARTSGTVAPSWITERGNPPLWETEGLRARQWVITVIASGIVAEGALAARHFIAGPPTSLASQAQGTYLYTWVAAAAGAVCTFALCFLDRRRGAGVACLAAPLATLTAVAGFLAVNTALGGQLSVRYVLTIAQDPLAVGLLLCLTAALVGLIPQISRSQERPAWARIQSARVVSAFLLATICGAVVSALLIIGRNAIVGPATTSLANSVVSPEVTPAKLAGLRYLKTAAAIETAYSSVKHSINAAQTAYEAAHPGLAVALLQYAAVPKLRKMLQYAEAVQPGTTQLAGIHGACLAALRDAIVAESLLARAIQNGDLVLNPHTKFVEQAAIAEWDKWQVDLLRLRLGDGIPVAP